MPFGFEMIGGLISVVVYSVMLFAAYKIFQIANDLSELKELLRDIRRNTTSATPSAPHSPESLARAVNQASYSEIIDEAIRSEQPR
jgi:hypothetical protein